MKHPSHLSDSPTNTHTRTHTRTTSTPLPFLLYQAGLHPVRPKSLPSLHLSSSVCASRCFCRLLFAPPSKDSSPLCDPHIHPHRSPPLCLNSFGPREQTKNGLCPGGRDGVSLSEGTGLLLVALNLKLLLSLSLSARLSLINYHQFTFTEPHNTSARYSTISLLHQPTGRHFRTPSDSNFSKAEKKNLTVGEPVNLHVCATCFFTRIQSNIRAKNLWICGSNKIKLNH